MSIGPYHENWSASAFAGMNFGAWHVTVRPLASHPAVLGAGSERGIIAPNGTKNCCMVVDVTVAMKPRLL